MVKSASKYMSYRKLIEIQENNYKGSTEIEYNKEEIDNEIYAKMSKQDEQHVNELLKRWE